MDFIELESYKIPRISIGTSPFIGAGQFGQLGVLWRSEFLQNTEKMVRLMTLSNEKGAKGVEAIPAGHILDAAVITRTRNPEFTILGSTGGLEADHQ